MVVQRIKPHPLLDNLLLIFREAAFVQLLKYILSSANRYGVADVRQKVTPVPS